MWLNLSLIFCFANNRAIFTTVFNVRWFTTSVYSVLNDIFGCCRNQWSTKLQGDYFLQFQRKCQVKLNWIILLSYSKGLFGTFNILKNCWVNSIPIRDIMVAVGGTGDQIRATEFIGQSSGIYKLWWFFWYICVLKNVSLLQYDKWNCCLHKLESYFPFLYGDCLKSWKFIRENYFSKSIIDRNPIPVR